MRVYRQRGLLVLVSVVPAAFGPEGSERCRVDKRLVYVIHFVDKRPDESYGFGLNCHVISFRVVKNTALFGSDSHRTR